MCFVFEHQKPFFYGISLPAVFVSILAVNVNKNGTGVYFFGKFNIIKLSVFFEILCANNRHIHKCYRSVGGSINFGVHIGVVFKRLLKAVLKITVFNFYFFKPCIECCMTTMVGPVCVQNAYFCLGRISFDGLEIILQKTQIIQIHCKSFFF